MSVLRYGYYDVPAGKYNSNVALLMQLKCRIRGEPADSHIYKNEAFEVFFTTTECAEPV